MIKHMEFVTYFACLCFGCFILAAKSTDEDINSMLNSWITDADCTKSKPIPYLSERVVGYVFGPSEQPISDFYLNWGWYSMKGFTLSSDPNKGCGAHVHWYLNDSTLPAENETMPNIICVADGTPCWFQKPILVKNCSKNDYRFLIPPTDASDEAYCIVPLDSVRVPDPAPEVGYLNPVVHVQLNSETSKKEFKLECLCNFTVKPQDKGLHFNVEWSVTDTSGRVKQLRASTAKKEDDLDFNYRTKLSEDHLISHGITKLGFRIACSVRAKVSIAGQYSVARSSPSKFCGIEMLSGTDIQVNGSEKVVISVQLTVPFRCPNSPSCTYDLLLLVPKVDQTCAVQKIASANIDNSKICGVRFKLGDVGKVKNITVANLMGKISDNHIGVSYNVLLQTRKLVGHKLYSQFTTDQIRIYSAVDYRKMTKARCYAHSDPHTKSFDESSTFENQAEGTFMLYRNAEYKTEIHTRHIACYRQDIFCNEAVSIRVGRDVYIIDKRTGHTAFTLCDDLVLAGKVRRTDTNTFLVFLPSGAEVIIRVMQYLEIDITPGLHDYGKTDGLCGKFDNNPANDADKPPGCTKARHLCWKLEATDSLFDKGYIKQLQGWTETLNLCTCDCAYEDQCPLSDTINCNPPTQVQCQIESSKPITNGLCTTSRRKRDIHTRHIFEPDDGFKDKTQSSFRRVRRDATVLDFQAAYKACTDEMNTTSVQMCSNLPGLDAESYFQNCAMDLMATNSYDWVQVHIEALKLKCIRYVEIRQPLDDEILQNVTLVQDISETVVNDSKAIVFNKALLECIKDVSCPNDCSNHGRCEKGECRCTTGFIGFDCSVDVNAPPDIIGIPDSGLCDLSERPCEQTMVVGQNFVESSKLVCRVVPLKIYENAVVVRGTSTTVQAALDTFAQVSCPLPNTKIKRREVTQINVEVMAIGFAISVSNNGEVFSVEDSIVIFDSMCLSCMKQNGSISCTHKTEYCIHGGRCFRMGDTLGCYTCEGLPLDWYPGSQCTTRTEPSIERTTRTEPAIESTTITEPTTESTTRTEPTIESTTRTEPAIESTTRTEPAIESTTRIEPTRESTTRTDPTKESTTRTEPTKESITRTDPTKERFTRTDQTKESTTRTDPTEESTTRTEPAIESTTRTEPAIESTTRTEPTRESTTRIDQTKESTTRTEPAIESTTRIEPAIESTTRREPAIESTTRTEPAIKSTTRTEPTIESTTRTEPALESTTRIEPIRESTTITEPTIESTTRTEPTGKSTTRTEPTRESTTRTEPTRESTTRSKRIKESATRKESTTESTTVTEPFQVKMFWIIAGVFGLVVILGIAVLLVYKFKKSLPASMLTG